MSNEKFTALFQALADGYDEVAEDIAGAQRKHFEALVEEGFSEEQALELIKNFEMNGDT